MPCALNVFGLPSPVLPILLYIYLLACVYVCTLLMLLNALCLALSIYHGFNCFTCLFLEFALSSHVCFLYEWLIVLTYLLIISLPLLICMGMYTGSLGCPTLLYMPCMLLCYLICWWAWPRIYFPLWLVAGGLCFFLFLLVPRNIQPVMCYIASGNLWW